jgi:V/A-type H+/Na+-transporting ATPase subunit I
MIVLMKKIYLLVQKKDLLSALGILRDAGVLHVEHIQLPKSDRINELQEHCRLLERVISLLTHEHKQIPQVKADDWRSQAREIMGLAEIIDQIKDAMGKRQTRIEQWEPWGDFSVEDIELLRAKGLSVELVELPERDLSAAPADMVLEPIFIRRGMAHCLAVAKEGAKIPFKTFPLPHVGLNRMKEAQVQAKERIKEAEHQLIADSKYLDQFKEISIQTGDELNFQKVYAGKGEAEMLSYIRGFCPEDLCPLLEKLSRREQWALLMEDPAPEDDVPTLLRNPKWVQLVNPLFDFMNIIPGYREMDVSLSFLLFFSVFFGILIGDAGYGVTFFGLTLWARKKLGPKADRAPFELMLILSSCAIIWGLLTGTFFGQALFGKFVRPLWPWITNDINMQRLCFMIGVVHLTVAHVWRGMRKLPSWGVVSEVGWLSLLWASFFLANNMLFNDPLPGFVKYFFYIGPALVVLFNQPQRNFFKRIGLGLGDLFLTVMSMFVDLLSYVRLFAVGMAGLLLADSFNQMLSPGAAPNFIVGFITALILVAMHALNMILSVIAVLVHGLRLNIFEFSTHLGLEWKGNKYSPFRRTAG